MGQTLQQNQQPFVDSTENMLGVQTDNINLPLKNEDSNSNVTLGGDSEVRSRMEVCNNL